MALYETAETIEAKFNNVRNNLKDGFEARKNDTERLALIAEEFESSLVAQQKAEIRILSLQQELDALRAQPGSGSVEDLASDLDAATTKRNETLDTLSAAGKDDTNAYASLKKDIEEVDAVAAQLLAHERQRTVFHRIRANKLRDSRDRSDIDLAQSRQIIKRFNRDPDVSDEDAKRLAAELQSQVVNTTRQLIDLRNIVPVSTHPYVFDSALDLADLDNDRIRAPMATKLDSIKEELRDAIAALELAVRNISVENKQEASKGAPSFQEYNKVRSQYGEQIKKNTQLYDTIRILETALNNLEANVDDLEDEDADDAPADPLETKKLKATNKKLQNRIKRLQTAGPDADVEATKRELAVAESRVTYLQQKIEVILGAENRQDLDLSLLTEIETLKERLLEQKDAIEDLETEREDFNAQIEDLENKLTKAQAGIPERTARHEASGAAHKNSKDCEARIESLLLEISKLKATAKTSGRELVKANLDLEHLESESDAKHKIIVTLRKQAKTHIAQLQEEQGRLPYKGPRVRDEALSGGKVEAQRIKELETQVEYLETQRSTHSTSNPDSPVKATKKGGKAPLRATGSNSDEVLRLEMDIARLRKGAEASGAHIEVQRTGIAERDSRIVLWEERVEEKELEIIALNEEMSEWQDNVRELEDTQRELNAEIERLQVRIEELENANDVIDEELSQLRSYHGGDSGDIAALRALIAMLKAQVAELSQQLEACKLLPSLLLPKTLAEEPLTNLNKTGRAEKERKKPVKSRPKPRTASGGVKRKRVDPALIQLRDWQHDSWFDFNAAQTMSNRTSQISGNQQSVDEQEPDKKKAKKMLAKKGPMRGLNKDLKKDPKTEERSEARKTRGGGKRDLNLKIELER